MGKKKSSGRKLRQRLRQWFVQRDTVEEVELPSGLVLLSRKADMLYFVVSGDVPQTFFGSMMTWLNEDEDGDEKGKKELDLSNLPTDVMASLLDLSGRMMVQCVTYPSIVLEGPTIIADDDEDEEADEGEDTEQVTDQINVNRIGAQDKFAYFSWVTGGADALKPFRQEETGGNRLASSGEGVQPKAE